ncbi:MAG: hypothetical protein SF051_01465 [Elusimicrobiota bacterium]|nr:hypothetical protein [Elusimicrobiota bacterium]
MGKTHNAKELLEQLELSEAQEYPEEARDEAQALLLSRHLALLKAMRGDRRGIDRK